MDEGADRLDPSWRSKGSTAREGRRLRRPGRGSHVLICKIVDEPGAAHYEDGMCREPLSKFAVPVGRWPHSSSAEQGSSANGPERVKPTLQLAVDESTIKSIIMSVFSEPDAPRAALPEEARARSR